MLPIPHYYFTCSEENIVAPVFMCSVCLTDCIYSIHYQRGSSFKMALPASAGKFEAGRLVALCADVLLPLWIKRHPNGNYGL
jgi:hypothetical protein